MLSIDGLLIIGILFQSLSNHSQIIPELNFPTDDQLILLIK